MTSDRGNGGAELQLNQPVTPKTPTLNPNAKVFPGPKTTTTLSTTQIPDNDDTTWQQQDQSGRNSASPSAQVTIQGPYQLNGDVCKYTPTGTVFPTSSESPLPITHLTLSNGYSTTEMTYTPNTEGHLVSEDEMAVEESQSKADSLRAMLKYQLEYYFSRENLASDTYLRSQMDADQYVPIWTIANFNAVKRLSSDMKLIVEVLRESPYLQVDDRAEKVRPITKRCIVMLREIPDSTPIEEVKALFSGEKCPTFTGCEFAHNTNWYITFESEADAQNAYKYLREEVQTFRGKPIMARIKAKPLQSVSSKPPNGFRQPTTPTPPPPTTNIFPQQHFQYSPVSPMMNGAPQQPFAFYPNPNVMPQHPPPPQQWPTSPPYYETSLPPFPGSGISGPQNYKPSNIAGRYGYQGSRNRNPNKMTHQRTPSTPETRNVERNNNHEIIRSPHERSNTANGTQSSSPRSIREDRRDLDRENGGYRTRRDNTSPKLGQQEMHPGSLQSRRGGYTRRGRKDDGPGRRNSREKKDEQPKVQSPKLDLAPSQFPPLPGRENVVKNEENENKVTMMPMADILKGVKDPKRPVWPLETGVVHKETIVNDSVQKHGPTPPASPTTTISQGASEERTTPITTTTGNTNTNTTSSTTTTTTITAAVPPVNSKVSQQSSTANNNIAQKQDEAPKLSYAQMLTQMPAKKPPPPPPSPPPPTTTTATAQQQKNATVSKPQPQRHSSQRNAVTHHKPTNLQTKQNADNMKEHSANGLKSPTK